MLTGRLRGIMGGSRKPKSKRAKQAKVKLVLGEFKRGKLRSGSRKGPKVKSRAQAVAIALSQAGLSRNKK